ncbi:hypothetical protein ACFLTZ_05280, partial [Chloroflexota bacterium]
MLAKVAAPSPQDADKGTIRLDRYTRQSIKIAIREEVSVDKVIAQPVSRVCLVPSINIALPEQQLKSLLQNTLSVDSLPVCLDEIIYVILPAPSGGTSFKVISVEPGPGITTPDTEIELVSRMRPEEEHEHKHKPTVEVTYADVGGLDTEIKMLKELIDLP